MKVSQQPKVSALLCIFAGTCALLWLAGIAFCGIGRVCNCTDHEGDCAVHVSPVHEHEAVYAHDQGISQDREHHHDAEVHQHSTASHYHDGTPSQPCSGKNGCKCGCSTIQPLMLTMTPVVIPKTVLQSAPQHMFTAPPSETLRPAEPRDWVLTLAVCLGPAFHSLDSPALASVVSEERARARLIQRFLVSVSLECAETFHLHSMPAERPQSLKIINKRKTQL